MSEIISHTDRILIATFQGNPATSIIVIHSSTNTSEDEVIDRYYEERRGSIEIIPQHNVLAIIGDGNVRIGKDDGTFTYHQHTNRNGSLLLDIIYEKQLVITNTSFQKKMNKMWNYVDPSGRKYHRIVLSIGSDYILVSSNIRLSLKFNRNTLPRKITYNWPLFKSDKSLQDKYTVEINNRNISEAYERFIKVNSEVESEIVPIKPKKVHICPSTDETVNTARQDTRKAYKTYEDKVNYSNQYNNQETNSTHLIKTLPLVP